MEALLGEEVMRNAISIVIFNPENIQNMLKITARVFLCFDIFIRIIKS